MRPRLATAFLAGLVLAGGGPVQGGQMKEPGERRSTEFPRPADPEIAVRGELEAARRAGTLEAYDLFIRRNSNHKLAEVARVEREALRRRQG